MSSSAIRRTVMAALAALWAAGSTALAQAPPSPPPPLRSPEVHEDGRVTFRLRAPGAASVQLSREGVELPAPMTKDAVGVWTLTTAPLDPDYYGYAFEVDGVTLTDPSNPVAIPNFIWRSSEVHVPAAALPWEVASVPHGRLHRHFYRSAIVGDDRDFYVYTPPGYDPASAAGYPVLYLLHGYSDDASAWTAVGRAHVILDNLIAQGAAKPMLLVMPFGYGAPEILRVGFNSPSDPGIRKRNAERFRDTLLAEVIPEVERSYAVVRAPASRAIAGLSMGGGESLSAGLNGLDTFSWIGAFSSAVPEDYPASFPALAASAPLQPRLLWIACGSSDFLIAPNRSFHAWLEGKGIRHTWTETSGAHTWQVWRRDLAAFAPLLFR